jgi:hypothetical protein
MIRLAISVEGETEEAFVKDALCGHLRTFGVDAVPINMRGNISLDRIVQNIVHLYDGFDAVTTFYDFYGFKRHNTVDGDQLEALIQERVAESFRRRHRDLDARRFVPYIQMHEFEGLLFSDVEQFDILPDIQPRHIDVLRSVRQAFDTPEDINNSKETAPSKRILDLGIGYDKVEHGPIIAVMIDLSVIRSQCPRFDCWLSRVEKLGAF